MQHANTPQVPPALQPISAMTSTTTTTTLRMTMTTANLELILDGHYVQVQEKIVQIIPSPPPPTTEANVQHATRML